MRSLTKSFARHSCDRRRYAYPRPTVRRRRTMKSTAEAAKVWQGQSLQDCVRKAFRVLSLHRGRAAERERPAGSLGRRAGEPDTWRRRSRRAARSGNGRRCGSPVLTRARGPGNQNFTRSRIDARCPGDRSRWRFDNRTHGLLWHAWRAGGSQKTKRAAGQKIYSRIRGGRP